MQICPTCGRSTPEGRFCEHCGGRLQVPVQYPQQYATTLEARLTRMGFAIRRNVTLGPYQLSLTGQKSGVRELGVLFGMSIVFIAVIPMDNPDPVQITHYADRIAELAKESGATSHLAMTVTIPIIVTETISSDLRAWISRYTMEGYRYNMILFPAIAVHGSREILFSQKTAFVGAAIYPSIREFAATYLLW